MIFAKIMLIKDFERFGYGFKEEFPPISLEQRNLFPCAFDFDGYIQYNNNFKFYPFSVVDQIMVCVLPKLENIKIEKLTRLLFDLKIFLPFDDFIKLLNEGYYDKSLQ